MIIRVAAGIDRRVDARATIEEVGAAATLERVVAGRADEMVVAGSAPHGVIELAADVVVIQRGPGESDTALARIENLRVNTAGLALVGPANRETPVRQHRD